MDSDATLARACGDAMWAEDHATHALGMELGDIVTGEAEISMTVRKDMVNGHGLCHGGLIFTLADSAFAYACNTHNRRAVASGARIEFLAPARLGDRLTACARQLSQGRSTGVYDVIVSRSDGVQVALFRGNAHRITGQLVETDEGGSD
ncbi:MAG: hydroxyphenylacetyl-CoA thioesterase PaaI [Chromatocurvus sp.]